MAKIVAKKETGTRPKNLETLQLSLELLRRIPRSGSVTSKDLHDWVKGKGIHRDIRIIQSHMKKLCQIFQIACDEDSKPYRYSWLPNADGFSLARMSEHESLMLRLAEEHLRNLLPTHVMRSLEGFFAQARTNLDSQATNVRINSASEWLNKVGVVSANQPLLPPKIKIGVFEQITQALYNNFLLEIDYQNNRYERRTHHEAKPLGLVQQGPVLYLVCQLRDKTNQIHFALHRMHSARATTFTFTRPKFKLADYINAGKFGIGEGKKIKLQFDIKKAASKHLLETKLSTDQTEEELDEDYRRITATVVETERLTWWLQGFGADVKNVTRLSVDK